MWTSIYIANSKNQADQFKQMLDENGILANIRPVGSAATTNVGLFEIQVLESEAEDAQTIVCQGSVKYKNE